MTEYSVVGKSFPRVEGVSKVTGEAKYTEDLVLPRMLWGKILRSPYPHARIINIDTSRAEKLPGVMAVVTGRDTRGIRFSFVDTPRYPADEYVLAEDKVRYVGEEVAAVAATSEDVAEEALGLIEVEYEELPAVFDPEEALKDGAPQVHDVIERTTTTAWEDWGVGRKGRPYKVENNICATSFVTYGDVEEGFRQSDHIREDRFVIPATSHAAMEPHVALASFDRSGNLDIWLSHMGYEIKRYWLAKTLQIPLTKVRVLKTYVGGAFGGKVNLFSHEFLVAFLSKKTGRPVKIVLSREEVFAATTTSHRMIIDLKLGVKKDGTIMAQDMRIINDPGAYRGSSPVAMFLAHNFCNSIFHIPNLKHQGVGVYTNKSICMAKRGHGAPQARFAIDCLMEMIAEDLGIDPIDMMLRNVRKVGDTLPNGDTMASYGLPDCLREAARVSEWKKKRGKPGNRGVGVGVASMFSGSAYYPFGSAAIVQLNPDGHITLFTGSTECGQGSDTAVCQIAAEEMCLSMEDVVLVSGDSQLCPIDFGNWLSGGIYVSGKAVRMAAADAREQMLKVGAQYLDCGIESLEIKNGSLGVKGDGERTMSFAEVMRVSIQRHGGDPIIGKGFCKAIPEVEFYPSLSKGTGRFTDAYSFAAAVAEVEVDRETGKVKVLRITIGDDSGFPINPQSVEGQLESQAVMGVGDVLFEECLIEKGWTANASFGDYKIPCAQDAPELKTVCVDILEPQGPYGAKEVGECARAAVIPAIANAIYDAVGVRVKTLPITPDKILQGLREKSEAKPSSG
ncbi:MAG: molybdopterin cofactor-binding domain-containing protein [Dehalococcoidia bacterium]